MEDRKILLILILLISVFLFASPISVKAYSADTHAFLTDEIVKFYNQNFLNNKISDDLGDFLIDGSRHEDSVPRWMNHFYDPVYNRGLESNYGNGYASPVWATDSDKQNEVKYKIATAIPSMLTAVQERRISTLTTETDFTWDRAKKFYLEGDEAKAMYILGHILHLIEDASVPAHTRNDAYPPGDVSPYEEWTKKFTLSSRDFTLPRRLRSRSPFVLDSLQNYFDGIATYSNNNFYSADTIGVQSGYNLPTSSNLIQEDRQWFLVNEDSEFGQYKLIRVEKPGNFSYVVTSKPNLGMDSRGSVIMKDYWRILSTRAVQYGAGVVDLFFREVEAIEDDPIKLAEFLGEKEKETLLGKVADAVRSTISRVSNVVKETLVPSGTFEKSTEISLLEETKNEGKGLDEEISPDEGLTVLCSFNSTEAPSRDKLIINEIAWMGDKSDFRNEWIELKNISGKHLDVSGYQIIDKKEQIQFSIPSGVVLPPGGFYLIKRNNGNLSGPAADGTYEGALSNSNEGIRVFNNSCELLDEAIADPSWSAGNNETKQTMERTPSGAWQTSIEPGGTPKAENSIRVVLKPTVLVSVATVCRGEMIKESGSGFSKEGRVELHFILPNGGEAITEVATDKNGDFEKVYTMPENALLGGYTYYAVDMRTGIESNRINYSVVEKKLPQGENEAEDLKKEDSSKENSSLEMEENGNIGNEASSTKEFSGCSDGQININSAGGNDLEELTGIGPAYAERIIKLRREELFWSVDDLTRVSGIGEVKVSNIKKQGLACAAAPDDSSFKPYKRPIYSAGGSGGSSSSDDKSGNNGSNNNGSNNEEETSYETCLYETQNSPSRNGLIIDEVAWMGTSNSANDEWIKIKNTSSAELNLNGYQLVDKDDQIHITFTTTTIPAGGVILLERTDDSSKPDETADVIYTGALGNSEEGLRLFDRSCALLDEVVADPDWPAGNNETKQTMKRNPDLTWRTSGESDLVSENETPAALFSYFPEFPEVGEQIYFDASSSTDDGEITLYQWNFGNGYTTTTTSPSIIYIYQTAGYYNVSLTAYDDENANSSYSKSIGVFSTSSTKANHVVISEVMPGLGKGSSTVEFVELYNPTGKSVDLTGWRLERKLDQFTTSTQPLLSSFPTSSIPAYGFFLVGSESEDYIGKKPDQVYDRSYRLAYDNDGVILYDDNGLKIDEMFYQSTDWGKSWERNTFNNGACYVSQGGYEFEGNNCSGMTSFSIRDNPNPQNSKSLPEPRQTPTSTAPFTVNYNPDNLSISFNWEPYEDSEGSTSTVSYEIKEHSSPGKLIYSSTTPSYSKRIYEVGREYTFSFQAFDRDGLGSGVTTSTISAPSLLDKFYIYKDPRSSTSTKYLAEFYYSKYPFVPDVYKNNENDSWKAVVLYLNSEPDESFDSLDTSGNWNVKSGNALYVGYDDCGGAAWRERNGVVFADNASRCSSQGGDLICAGVRLDRYGLLEDNHVILELASSTSELILGKNDYVSLAYYSFSPSGDGDQSLSLAAVDRTRYYFNSDVPEHEAPVLGNLSTSFDDSDNLEVSWGRAVDEDTIDSEITYEINFINISSSSSTSFSLGNWESNGNRLSCTKNVAPGNTYLIGVRAKDDFDNYSNIATTTWSYPKK